MGNVFWDVRNGRTWSATDLATQKATLTKQLEVQDEARQREKRAIRAKARQMYEEEKALQAQHEQASASKKRQQQVLKTQQKQQASMQKKIDALRQRRQLLKEQEVLRTTGIDWRAPMDASKTNVLLQFVDDEIAKRKELAAAHTRHLAIVAA
ncbi:hypothetical protein SPRG_15629, partial [Saprolegnia parasitica CBS 223.65]